MKWLLLLVVMVFGAAAHGQEVRGGRWFRIFEPEVLDSFALKQGITDFPMFTKKVQRPGTIVLAAFGGDQLSVAVVRSKGVDPPADLAAAKAVAKILGDEEVDFNVKETSYASVAELDFSHRIRRHGMMMEGSVPLGRIVAELGQWKDLPKPVYVIVAARDGGLSGLNGTIGKSFRILKPEEVKPADTAGFELHFGFLSYLGLLILAGAGWLIARAPFRAIKVEILRPRRVKVAQTYKELLQQQGHFAFSGLTDITPSLLVLTLLAPLYLALDPSPPRLGLLMVASRGYFPIGVLYLVVPWLLSGFIVPKVIEWRKNRLLPGEEETLQDRWVRQHLIRGLIFWGIVAALVAAGIALALLSRRFPSYFTGIPPEIRPYLIAVPLFGGAGLYAIYRFMTQAAGAEPLPHGHPLIDAVQDIGREAGVTVDRVGVLPSTGFTVTSHFGGRVTLGEPVVNLLTLGEAMALAAYYIHQKRKRLFDAVLPLATTSILIIAFTAAPADGRTIFTVVVFGIVGTTGMVLRKKMKATFARWEGEALEFAVHYTQEPNDVLLGLARAGVIGWSGNREIEIVREYAQSHGLEVMDERPGDVIARERCGESRELENEESPAGAGLSEMAERD